MQDDLTLLVAVVDRSGSMSRIQSDMEEGLNDLIREQASQPGEFRLTVVLFDTEYETVLDYANGKDAPRIKIKPRGVTALLDAIGKTIYNVGSRLAALPEHRRPSKVVFAVFTDGLENDSCSYTRKDVFSDIKHQTDRYGWAFTFLGANQDAIAEGAKMGFSADSSMTYVVDGGARPMMQSVNAAMTTYRSGGSGTMAYASAERDASMGK